MALVMMVCFFLSLFHRQLLSATAHLLRVLCNTTPQNAITHVKCGDSWNTDSRAIATGVGSSVPGRWMGSSPGSQREGVPSLLSPRCRGRELDKQKNMLLRELAPEQNQESGAFREQKAGQHCQAGVQEGMARVEADRQTGARARKVGVLGDNCRPGE